MFPWRRILVPTDFSTASRWVFDYAIRAAGMTDAEILVLHVRITKPSDRGTLKFPADSAVYEYVEQQELDVLRRHILRVDENLRTQLIVRTGPDAAGEIAATAASEQADLIVMSTHARHHIPHILIGSTTLKVLAGCTIPILAVRYGIRKPLAADRMMIAVDAAEPPASMVELIDGISAHEEGELILAATSHPSEPEAQKRLSRWRSAFPRANSKTLMVDSEKELLRAADEEACSLIVLTTNCNKNGTLTGVAEYIIRHADRPVLIVPTPDSAATP